MTTALSANDDGFSLIEVIIATGILATALVTVSGLLVVSADALLAARQRSVAAALASAKLEELLADAEALRNGTEAGDDVNAAGAPGADASGHYRRDWSASPAPAFPDRLVLASVRVTTPTGARVHLHDVTLVTLVERPQ
jgi:prepilin-type N-terminal cleavage/methylation domain-containing protein